MNESSETTVVVAAVQVEKQEFDFGPYAQYVTGAVRDDGTLKIQTVVMSNVLYAKLRDHLNGFGFKRHPRQRYFFAPVTPETEAVALKMVAEIGTVEHPAPETVAAAPATPAPKSRKVTPAPKPTAKPKRVAKPKPKVDVDDAWVEDIPLA